MYAFTECCSDRLLLTLTADVAGALKAQMYIYIIIIITILYNQRADVAVAYPLAPGGAKV